MDLFVILIETGLLCVFGIPALYLACLSVLAMFRRRRYFPAGHSRRFALIVPAHDEEHTIDKTIRSLKSIDYPPGLFDVIVVADNCTDGTADRAGALGAVVFERTDTELRGKGYALRWIFDLLMKRSPSYDAFAVIDADSVASADFLHVMNGYLGEGCEVLQCNDLVMPNPHSWSTEVTRLGFTLHNSVRPLGRSVLGFSAGLKGNGMCFSAGLLRKYPWDAFGVTEDLQYGLSLLLNGKTVCFAPEAVVLAAMPAFSSNAVTQRQRWERGRTPVKRIFSRKLLFSSMTRGSLKLFDAWLDLVIPPIVQFASAVVTLLVIHFLAAIMGIRGVSSFLPAWTGIFILCLLHLFLGLLAVGADRGLYMSLRHIPRYAMWKVRVHMEAGKRTSAQEWIRTTREMNFPDGDPGRTHGLENSDDYLSQKRG